MQNFPPRHIGQQISSKRIYEEGWRCAFYPLLQSRLITGCSSRFRWEETRWRKRCYIFSDLRQSEPRSVDKRRAFPNNPSGHNDYYSPNHRFSRVAVKYPCENRSSRTGRPKGVLFHFGHRSRLHTHQTKMLRNTPEKRAFRSVCTQLELGRDDRKAELSR